MEGFGQLAFAGQESISVETEVLEAEKRGLALTSVTNRGCSLNHTCAARGAGMARVSRLLTLDGKTKCSAGYDPSSTKPHQSV